MEFDFIENVKRGQFILPTCTSCGRKSWPPSSICSVCFAKTAPKKIRKTGILLEFTTSHVKDRAGVFGIILMDDGEFRLLGSIDETCDMHKGMLVKMDRCGLNDDGSPYYHFVCFRK